MQEFTDYAKHTYSEFASSDDLNIMLQQIMHEFSTNYAKYTYSEFASSDDLNMLLQQMMQEFSTNYAKYTYNEFASSDDLNMLQQITQEFTIYAKYTANLQALMI
jgi:hypothetical protein